MTVQSLLAVATSSLVLAVELQNDHHYEAPPCLDDEVAARLSKGGGALCASKCGADGSCSSDFPEDVQNPEPACALQDQAGNKYCALTCGRTGGDCPSGASCASGVCVFPEDAKLHSVQQELSAAVELQNDHHYEAPPCLDDEVAARLSKGGGALCASKCGADGSCSSDFPEDVQNPEPACALQDQAGNKYCALTCGRTGGDCPSGASCASGVCVFPEDIELHQELSPVLGPDFSQLVCSDRKCSSDCEPEGYTFDDCLPVVGGGSARGVSCCDNADCTLAGSVFGLVLDVFRSDNCTGAAQRMKEPVKECDRTSSGDQKFAKFVCGGSSFTAKQLATELLLRPTISV